MQKVFIDCGYHLGEGLNEFTQMLGIDDAWEVYAFEANPYCEMDKKLHQHPFKVNAFNKAIWINEGRAWFNCQNQKSARSPVNNSTHELDGWGSCLTDINSTHVYQTKEEVETIDFSSFLKQFRGKEVYVKMDVEGAEFEVLRKCIQDRTYDIMNTLWIEWHDVNLANESPETVRQIKSNLSGVVVYDWK